MADWTGELGNALASGDPEWMKATLRRVPNDVVRAVIPHLGRLAKASEKQGRLEESLAYYEQLIWVHAEPAGAHADCARVLLAMQRPEDAALHAQRIVELAPERAAGYRLQAQACTALGDLPGALAALRQAARLEPGDEATLQRIATLEDTMHRAECLRHALEPEAAPAIELPPVAAPPFDPALLDDAAMPSSFERFRIEGLLQHLQRYGDQLGPRQAIGRLEDPLWLAAWDAALRGTAQSRVVFRGSELGVLALRALQHGAAHVQCLEAQPLGARITTGMVQKHLLAPWRAQHGAAIAGWTEEQRRASFEAFASAIDIDCVQPAVPSDSACDCFVFPQIDHTLLGTGIVEAVRQYVGAGRPSPARILPARASVFAMAVQWVYPGTDFRLDPLNRLRWSLYPQPLELGPAFWTGLTEPVRVAEIDFANFSQATLALELPVVCEGSVDAIVFWFELQLGDSTLSSAPGSALRCIAPAVQYTDPVAVRPGSSLPLSLRVEPTRLCFRTRPPASLPRAGGLPGWYLPMLGDERRNQAYRNAIGRALASSPADLVLDIGAGCGLLSMMAAGAGAAQVVGCESDATIATIGREIVALNGLADRITLVDKDCRQLNLPGDLPRRADLAIFELFDCSLIGEGVLHLLAHAREHLLAPNARFLPAAARIRAMLVEYRVDRFFEIDAELLNPYRVSPSFVNVDASKLPYRALTEPFDVFSFDFAEAGPTPQQCELCPTAIAAGAAGALLFWFDLGLEGDHWISNDPMSDSSLHWKQGLQALPEVRVEPGMALPLVAAHDGSGLQFRWQHDALPREALSKLPRWDPRCLAASQELDLQTRGLLQHCAQQPGEYAKVVEIARRFAIDPAAHALDPTVAQRFASMLLKT